MRDPFERNDFSPWLAINARNKKKKEKEREKRKKEKETAVRKWAYNSFPASLARHAGIHFPPRFPRWKPTAVSRVASRDARES